MNKASASKFWLLSTLSILFLFVNDATMRIMKIRKWILEVQFLNEYVYATVWHYFYPAGQLPLLNCYQRISVGLSEFGDTEAWNSIVYSRWIKGNEIYLNCYQSMTILHWWFLPLRYLAEVQWYYVNNGIVWDTMFSISSKLDKYIRLYINTGSFVRHNQIK